MIDERVSKVLQTQCGLASGDRILVGVSGGPDSLVLLDLLYKSGFSIIVAHFDHRLRKESSQDAIFVKGLAGVRGLDFIHESGDTEGFAQDKRVSIEEAARELRYRFLFKHAQKIGVSCVAVGHNADDQVETILMHLIRGTGLDGLVGMQYLSMTGWSSNIPLIRPLLGIWREELLQYCSDFQLKPRFDLTNLDVTFFRNRLRRELLPTLEEYNPNFKYLIWKMSQTISGDKVLLDDLVDGFMKSLILERGDTNLAIDLYRFSAVRLGLQRRIIRKAISYLRPGLRDIGFEAIEKALVLISDTQSTRQADLIAGLSLQVESDRFILSDWKFDTNRKEWPQIFPSAELKISAPGLLTLENGWKLVATVLEFTTELKPSIYLNPDPFIAYVDLEACGNDFLLRSRQPGDRFEPLGMNSGSVKISDFMINVQLPVRARKRWPLLFSKERLVWVPGYRISEYVKVGDSTKKLVQFTLKKPENIKN